jgi:hypothetical protein
MVDSRPDLVEACRENDDPHTIALLHRLSARDLVEIAGSEHADVVLALNVLHHMPDWRSALEAILALGERVIIETPGRGDVGSANYDRSQAILDALEALDVTRIGTARSHVTPGVDRPMFLVHRPKSTLTACYAYGERVRPRGAITPRRHVITSTLDEKSIAFDDGVRRPWVPGLNLWNWAQLGGAYPCVNQIKGSVVKAWIERPLPHGDFRPWNLILGGQGVTAIDAGHRRSVDDVRGLNETLEWIADPREAYAACA